MSTNFAPFHELQHFIQYKNRYISALIFSAIGFVFIMSGLLIGLIEVALQYEAQGFIFWTALFTLASALVILGGLSVIVGRLVIPKRESLKPRDGIDPQLNFGQVFADFLQRNLDASHSPTEGPLFDRTEEPPHSI